MKPRRTILLADDEQNVRSLVRASLDGNLGTILEADNGDTALELARSAQPDVAILDWRMPGRSGIEVARLLADGRDTVRIPVILLTARHGKEDRQRARACGVFAHLAKPFSPLELLAKVEEALDNVEGDGS